MSVEIKLHETTLKMNILMEAWATPTDNNGN